VPVYLLDSDLPQNDLKDRDLTSHLYGGDQRYRLKQEIILGIGGVRMLRALGHHSIERYHMNEGHAALLTYELLAQRVAGVGRKPDSRDLDAVRRLCVFTTHTPVPAGHDKFPMDLVHEILGDDELLDYEDVFCCDGVLNMTRTALKLSRYVNGVAKRHGEVSRQMFLPYSIDSITNGVHAGTWASSPIIAMFDRHIPGWRDDNFSLRYTMGIPDQELWTAHMETKAILIDEVNRATHVGMDRDVFTICYARRATAYKRPDMLISDLDRLRAIAAKVGPLQIIYSGKAHPRDTQGKDLIELVHKAAAALAPEIKLVYLPNYTMATAAIMTAGGDVWLNTPQPPMEASGTSGMKAALNGVPSLSTLDGWWLEGCIEGVTGWAIGGDSYARQRSHPGEPPANGDHNHVTDAVSLYEKLERTILPMYLHERGRFIDVMRNAIALNGSFFNTERMVHEYVLKAYFA
jgi:starch phosphorylase